MTAPLISCIMATRGGAFPARAAIGCYRRQTWPNRELIVVSADPAAPVAGLIEQMADPSIRFLPAPVERVGALRNHAIAAARGELIAVWDDDDLSHPSRLEWQHQALAETGTTACVLARLLLWWPGRSRLAIGFHRTWENTLLAVRAELPAYSNSVRSSDTELVRALVARSRVAMLDRPAAYVYVAHGANLWHEAHFEMLFANGDETDPARYPELLDQLRAALPIDDYLAGLAARAKVD